MTTANFDEISYVDCLELLRLGHLGRIAVVRHDFPVVVPVNYRLIETPGRAWITVRTRPGNMLDCDRAPAAFQVDHIDDTAHEGWSVLVQGTLLRADPEAADFRARFDPQPWILDVRDRWLVIEPFAVSGRRLHAVATGESPAVEFYR
jgi:nitroimidazol reductase NimA-like FMN-containing flavoprotein (pyridoxamine 5'-phosphate oxidase superfamily)